MAFGLFLLFQLSNYRAVRAALPPPVPLFCPEGLISPLSFPPVSHAVEAGGFFCAAYKKTVDKATEICIINFVRQNTAGLCKGSTADSDSVCEGSNPSPAAMIRGCNASCVTSSFLLSFAYDTVSPASSDQAAGDRHPSQRRESSQTTSGTSEAGMILSKTRPNGRQ